MWHLYCWIEWWQICSGSGLMCDWTLLDMAWIQWMCWDVLRHMICICVCLRGRMNAAIDAHMNHATLYSGLFDGGAAMRNEAKRVAAQSEEYASPLVCNLHIRFSHHCQTAHKSLCTRPATIAGSGKNFAVTYTQQKGTSKLKMCCGNPLIFCCCANPTKQTRILTHRKKYNIQVIVISNTENIYM